MKLVDKTTRREVTTGQTLISFRGETSVLVSWREPGNTGGMLGKVHFVRFGTGSSNGTWDAEWIGLTVPVPAQTDLV